MVQQNAHYFKEAQFLVLGYHEQLLLRFTFRLGSYSFGLSSFSYFLFRAPSSRILTLSAFSASFFTFAVSGFLHFEKLCIGLGL